MHIHYGEVIELHKEPSSLDTFTIKFCNILNKLDIDYVLVSGYVSILFGRSRSSEDIDLIMGKMGLDSFTELFRCLSEDFECITPGKPKELFEEYLTNGLAIRLSLKGTYIPNMEVKFPKSELDSWVLSNKKKVMLNESTLFISCIELQVAFKLFLGSEKDIEDALHLFHVFKDSLDMELLQAFNRKLNIGRKILELLE